MLGKFVDWMRSSSAPAGERATHRLEVTESIYRGIPLLSLKGELDQQDARRLAYRIRETLTDRDRYVLLGLSGLEYIGSGGLYLFIDIANDLSGRGWLGIIGPRPDLRRMFEIVGLTELDSFRMFENSEEAFTAARREEATDRSSRRPPPREA